MPINTSSEDLYYLYPENNNQKGGLIIDIKNEPHGGFPPIFIVDSNNKLVEKTKNRELVIKKTAVSIKTLLENIKKN